MAMAAELQERRRADMNSEPVYQVLSNDAWIDLSQGAMAAQQRVGASVRTLYRHAQPAKGLELAGWQFKSVNGVEQWLCKFYDFEN